MRQSYTVTMIKGGVATPDHGCRPVLCGAGQCRSKDDGLYGIVQRRHVHHQHSNVKVFAGTVDDPFWIDLGGVFDTLNTSISPVLSPAQDAALQNIASDTLSGYAVNSIAIEVPVSMLTRTGAVEAASSTAATIGVWGTTSRPRTTVRRSPLPAVSSGTFNQIQRMGNPLINELW